MLKDITTKADVHLLVDEFYTKVASKSSIIDFFKNINWEEHKPRMYGFWYYVLLDEPATIHSIYDTHQKLNIKPEDFEEWLRFFKEALDTNFNGPKANLAWQRALIIANTFNSKMNPGTELNFNF